MDENAKFVIFIEKRNYLIRTLKLFNEKNEITIKELKLQIPSASYYRFLLPKIIDLNNLLVTQGMDYFISPIFIKNGSEIASGLKINPKIEISINHSYILLKPKRVVQNEPYS